MQVRVQLFAMLAHEIGCPELTIDLSETATAQSLLTAIGQQYPQLITLLQRTAVAVNYQYVKPSCKLSADDEIALIPPVSGGSTTPSVRAIDAI